MIILGLNAYHGDAAACIFKDGKLVAAAEEERFTRIKHSAGFPVNSIKFCLEFCNISLSSIDHIAINRNPNQKIIPKLLYAASNVFKIKFFKDRLLNLKKIHSLKNEFLNHFNEIPKAEIHNIDHHSAHIAGSVFFSGFKDSNFLSVDGFGDFASTVSGFYDGKKIIKYDEVLFPHSLGLFYTAITQYLGFMKYGDEYKVMGLASYGKPIYFDKINQLFIKKNLFSLNLDYFLHHTGNVEMTWLTGEPKIGKVFSNKLIELLGPARNNKEKVEKFHMDIAASAQKAYEEIFFDIANNLYKKNQNDYLCLSGGCAMNSVANGKIYERTKYKKVYIQAAPGDSGGAVGAASIVLRNKNSDIEQLNDNPYLGPSYSLDYISEVLAKNEKILSSKLIKVSSYDNKDDLLKLTADLLSKEKIVGFFQGRMEWGPRALGNRSILADPRNKNIREILNLKIKRRENFRPFAPSILKETVNDWFEKDDDVPFMSKVLKIKNEKRSAIPAVTHVDGTGRLQTVSKDLNHDYYKLISFFNEITGIPILLNTSFNENEPIVCNPEQALDCFLRTKMDVLVLENYILIRK